MREKSVKPCVAHRCANARPAAEAAPPGDVRHECLREATAGARWQEVLKAMVEAGTSGDSLCTSVAEIEAKPNPPGRPYD